MSVGNRSKTKHNAPIFRYSDGWKDSETFDLSTLPLDEQKEYGRLFGMMITMGSTPKSISNIALSIYDDSQADYFAGILGKDNYDIKIRQHSKKDPRQVVSIKNPALMYHYREPFSEEIGPIVQKSVLEGVITGTTIRTNKKRAMNDKLIWMTRNKILSDHVREISDITTNILNYQIDYKFYSKFKGGKYRVTRNSLQNNGRKRGETMYSVWFLDTYKAKDFLIDDGTFEEFHDYIKTIPDFSTPDGAWIAQRKFFNFRKGKLYEQAVEEGRMDVDMFTELTRERTRISKEMDKAIEVLAELQATSNLIESFDRTRSDEIDSAKEEYKKINKRLSDMFYDIDYEIDKLRPRRPRKKRTYDYSYARRMTQHALDEYRNS